MIVVVQAQRGTDVDWIRLRRAGETAGDNKKVPMLLDVGDEVRRRRTQSEVRHLLVKAAARVFARQGYALTTIDDIAKEAGVAVSVLYRNFGSKSALLQEAVLKPFSNFLDKLVAVWESQQDEPLDEFDLFRAFVAALDTTFHEHADALRGLIYVDATLDPAAAQGLHTIFKEFFSRIRKVDERRAAAHGWIVTGDVELIGRIVISMVAGATVFERWFISEEYTRDEVIDHMSGLLLRGMIPARRPGGSDSAALPPLSSKERLDMLKNLQSPE